MFNHLHTDVAYYYNLRMEDMSSKDIEAILLAIHIYKCYLTKYQQMMAAAARKHFVIMDKINSDMQQAMMHATK